MDEITSASDAYSAQNKLGATYLSLGIPIAKKLKVVGGIRYEHNVMSLQGHVNLDSISPSVTTKFVLPSVNASYNFTDKSLVRAAYGKTLNRPEFREWSPFYFYDFDFRAGTYGSLFPTSISPNGSILKVAEIKNYDLRYEFYPQNGEMIQFGVFYKDIINPIQQAVVLGGTDSKSFSYINAESAFVKGIELETRKNLSSLDSILGTRFFSSLNVVANISLMKSQLTVAVLNAPRHTDLEGQSPYVINGGLYYQNDSIGLQVSVLYNVFGPRIFLLGTNDFADIGEMPRHSLDLTISKTIWKKIIFSLGIQDILNQPVLLVQDTNRDDKFTRPYQEGPALTNSDDKMILKYYRGQYFTFGIKVIL